MKHEAKKQSHRLVPIACKYRNGKYCHLPSPFMRCPYYQEGATAKDQPTCGAVKD